MPNNKNNPSKKTTQKKEEEVKYIPPENAVVSRLGQTEEVKKSGKSGSVVTRHVSTIRYS